MAWNPTINHIMAQLSNGFFCSRLEEQQNPKFRKIKVVKKKPQHPGTHPYFCYEG